MPKQCNFGTSSVKGEQQNTHYRETLRILTSSFIGYESLTLEQFFTFYQLLIRRLREGGLGDFAML